MKNQAFTQQVKSSIEIAGKNWCPTRPEDKHVESSRYTPLRPEVTLKATQHRHIHLNRGENDGRDDIL
jgi:hypothetical protein